MECYVLACQLEMERNFIFWTRLCWSAKNKLLFHHLSHPNLLGMTESCVLIGKWQKFNTQTKILPQVLWSNNFKWCPTNDPRADVQRANLVASIKNGIKHFLFSTTATIAQKSLLIHLSGCPPKSGPASLGSPVNLPFIFCGWKGLNEEWLKSS